MALQESLVARPDHLVDKFTEKNLRQAFNKELEDIISIIRHAATGSELLTIEQGVDKVLIKVKSVRAFTEEQKKLLELIRRHRLQNLLLEEEDVDYLPIFTRQGASWGKLDKVFGGDLEIIIQETNKATQPDFLQDRIYEMNKIQNHLKTC
jgi:hypothetical protein